MKAHILSMIMFLYMGKNVHIDNIKDAYPPVLLNSYFYFDQKVLINFTSQ